MAEKEHKTIEQPKGIPGVVNITLVHKIESTRQSVEICWPKFPIDEWEKILSFFKWTQDTYASESQVRLYVNPTLGTWRAWAFPQTARGGMTTREMDTPDAAEQRRQFPDSAGWSYFGTVHHHCTASAFASGTDDTNEANQDGIHITVGHIDKPTKSIHIRMIILRQKTDNKDFDASTLFDVTSDPDIAATPERFRRAIIGIHGDDIARRIMASARDDQPFPEEWKTNMVHVTHEVGNVGGAGSGASSGGYGISRHDNWQGNSQFHYTGASVNGAPTKWARPDEKAKWIVKRALTNIVKHYKVDTTEQLISVFTESVSIGWLNSMMADMHTIDFEPIVMHRVLTRGQLDYDYTKEYELIDEGVDIDTATNVICHHRWPASAVIGEETTVSRADPDLFGESPVQQLAMQHGFGDGM